VDLFELGRVFSRAATGFHQEYRLGIVSAGAALGHWAAATRTLDYYAIKGVVEALMRELRLDWKLEAGAGGDPLYHPSRAARVMLDGQSVGVFGEAHPAALAEAKLAIPVVLAELAVEKLMAAKARPVKALPVMQFPRADRDLAVVVDDGVTFAALKRAVDETGGKLLEESRLFDVFTGGSIEAGKKSLALSLSFRHAERTLTDAEVDRGMQRIVQRLEKEFGARLR